MKYTKDNHEHKYIPNQWDGICDYCGLTRSTIEDVPMKKRHCDYENCKLPVFATENLTGMKGKLCMKHLKQVFAKVIAKAEIKYD